jgi:DNA-directed RNA polymerase specialized sigma subunit
MDALYDLPQIATQAGVSATQFRELEVCVRAQYSSDEMMIELRLLRTLRAIGDGTVSAGDAIREFRAATAAENFNKLLQSRHVADAERLRITEFVRTQLSPVERLLLALYYYERKSYAEIGVVVALPEEGVRDMHAALLARLRGFLGSPLADRVFRVAG